MNNKLRILLVEDLDSDAEMLIRFLKREEISFVYHRVWQRIEYIEALDTFVPDLIISDHSIPGFGGMEAFHILKESKKNIPFILTTGTVSEKLLTEYMKEGLDDYILKENLLRLPSAIENVLNKKKIEKLHAELTTANKRLESAYTEMKDSINYASRIQRALLPSPDEMREVCGDYFVFHRPKDVVSGDFYWCSDTRDSAHLRDLKIIAAVDCTGHGVPGAFMSMLGNTLLNQCVKDPNINSPAEVLDFLNAELPKNLKSYEQDISVRDGMDISLCVIDFKNNKLSFAGANNSCSVARNGELIELKADKQAISAAHDTEKKQFSNKELKLQKGDTIYLYTDGYADQFGGPSGKKFMRKNLKKLLTLIHKKFIKEQESLIRQNFEEWQGEHEQIDDVLVMGIQF